jgi:hypothetical protein
LDVKSNQSVLDDFLIDLNNKSDLTLILGNGNSGSFPLFCTVLTSFLFAEAYRSSRAPHEYQYSSIRDLRSYMSRSILMRILCQLFPRESKMFPGSAARIRFHGGVERKPGGPFDTFPRKTLTNQCDTWTTRCRILRIRAFITSTGAQPGSNLRSVHHQL